MISCLRTRLATVLVGGALALSLGALTTAAPALAAGPAPAHRASYSIVPVGGVAKPRADSAATSCGASNWKVKMLGTNFDVYLCAVTVVNTTGLGPFSTLTINAANRVWLHQNANNSGWADCFSDIGWPDFEETFGLTGTRDANPGNIQMAANTTFC
jgi:hypothetical protein